MADRIHQINELIRRNSITLKKSTIIYRGDPPHNRILPFPQFFGPEFAAKRYVINYNKRFKHASDPGRYVLNAYESNKDIVLLDLVDNPRLEKSQDINDLLSLIEDLIEHNPRKNERNKRGIPRYETDMGRLQVTKLFFHILYGLKTLFDENDIILLAQYATDSTAPKREVITPTELINILRLIDDTQKPCVPGRITNNKYDKLFNNAFTLLCWDYQIPIDGTSYTRVQGYHPSECCHKVANARILDNYPCCPSEYLLFRPDLILYNKGWIDVV
jgi:hypothetical protein